MGFGHASWGMRSRVLWLIQAGWSGTDAARRAGVHKRAVLKWAKLAGMRMEISRYGGVVAAPDVVGGQGHGRRLTLAERVLIQALAEQSCSQRVIAARVGVHQSTIARELARGRTGGRTGHLPGRGYHALAGQHRAAAARARPKPRKLDTYPLLRAAVIDGLNKRFSPQQIAGKLARDFAGVKGMRVSTETIYQALYVQGRGALRDDLKQVKILRSGRTGRKPRSALPAAKNRPWLDGCRLTQRPPEADDRAVPGHYEGDLVVGPDRSGLITLIERRSRYCLIGRLPGNRESATVIDKMRQMIQDLPGQLSTITWDQGSEMAQHAEFTIATHCQVYFCDPHSPWQRASNENLNGLIRDFYPKGTNFNHVSDADIQHMQDLINDRPRHMHNYATAREILTQYIQDDALTP